MAAKTKKGGLGRGLDSLITAKVEEEAPVAVATGNENGGGVMVDINKVEPNREQPRKFFDEDALIELSESIKEKGVLSPLLVVKKDDYYMIVAGERRWRASRMAGLKEVPVIIRDLTDREIAEISLIENLQREDLNKIEEALAYKRLIEEFGMKQDEVAERVSKGRPTIANALRLLKLDERVQKMIIDGMIQEGHARQLLSITDGDKQYEFAQRVFDEKMNVREVEKEIKRMNKEDDGSSENSKPEIDPKLIAIYRDLEEKLKQNLGTKVSIHAKDNHKGKLEIEYYSQDELDRLVDLLQAK
ncbi:MAG: ParB/RepB/Spo0J family partition protein [Lachnospiraceae bacterium]|jgi:ParB family chromosome partitioning protein|nr:ParB/RepB/Spo0J family partition protein [Lachnospiraceae bacterium]MBR6282003.1 ParB/RepB/Spo0J family partition protein [Lachnospiraceae bacterium]